jgi:hypothetical protein
MTKISARAKKTLDLIKKGKFYRPYDRNRPASIDELLEAGLIRCTGRPMIVVAAYVPTEGYTDYVPEKFEESK